MWKELASVMYETFGRVAGELLEAPEAIEAQLVGPRGHTTSECCFAAVVVCRWPPTLGILREVTVAFDMFSGSLREEIGHHEVHIFALAAENKSQYPELSGVWASFNTNPRLSVRQAGALIHELIDLLAANGGTSNKALASTVIRLLAFFSAAYRNDLEVKCSSD